MFPILLLSITFVPVVLGILLTRTRRKRGRFAQLLGILALYYMMYIAVLFLLRGRWIG